MTTIIKRAVSGKTINRIGWDSPPIFFERSREHTTGAESRSSRLVRHRNNSGLARTVLALILALWCVAPCGIASAKEFGVIEDLYVGRNTSTPYGGIGRYQNLLTYSDSFDNVAWVKTNVSAVTADQITAPDGTTTGEALAPATAAATNVKNTSSTSAAASTAYTFSVWLKAASGTKDIVLTVGDTATNNTATASLTTSWQRFSVTYTSSATPSGNVFGQIGNAAWTADTIHAWGGQLEQASSVGVYAKTTSGTVAASRGIVSTGDFLMPSLKLSGGAITDTTGTVTVGSNLASSGNLQITGAGPHYISTGNVGIGTTNPSYKLDVVGQMSVSDSIGVGGAISDTTFGVRSAKSIMLYNNTGINWANTNVFITNGGASSTDFIVKNWDGSAVTEHFRVTGNGNVGIGTTAPNQKLDVSGSGTISGNLGIGTTSPGSGLTYGEAKLHIYGTNAQGTSLIVENNGSTALLGSELLLKTSNQSRGKGITMYDTVSKNTWGIGVPYSGSNKFQIGYVSDYTAQGTFQQTEALRGTTDALFTIQSNGYVGIGTTSPSQPLEVSSNVTGHFGIKISATGTGYPKLQIDRAYAYRPSSIAYSTVGADTWYAGLLYKAGQDNNDYSISQDINFSNSKFVLTSSGNVGIGTTGPGAKLQIDGANALLKITDSMTAANSFKAGMIESGGVAYPMIWFNQATPSDSNSAFWANGQNSIFNTPSAPMYFRVANSGYMALSADGLAINTGNSASGAGNGLIVGTGNVGIGTTSPTQKLEVNGTVKATSFDGAISTSGNLASSGNLQITGSGPHYISAGNVGIGTTSPNKKLDVVDIMRVTRAGSPDIYTEIYGGSGAHEPYLNFKGAGGTGYIQNAGTDIMAFTSTGNVGIGTTVPGAKLDINGSPSLTSGMEKILLLNRPYNNGVAFEAGVAFAVGQSTTGVGSRLDILLDNADNNIQDYGLTAMSINSSGNVGIGTTAPGYKLDVRGGDLYVSGNITAAGTVTGVGGAYASGSGTQNYISKWNNAAGDTLGNSIIYDTGTNVGIGTTAPAYKLDISSTIDTAYVSTNMLTATPSFNIQNTSTTAGVAASIRLGANGAGTQGVSVISSITTGSGESALAFGTRDGGNVVEHMRIIDGGNVGIGTTSPGAKLEVTGNSYFNGKVGIGVLNSTYGFEVNSAYALWLHNGATAIMYASTGGGGKVSIGSSSDPKSDLYVANNVSIGSNAVAAPTNGLIVAGNVGIGTTGPTQKLEINGNIEIGHTQKIQHTGNSTNYIELYNGSSGALTLQAGSSGFGYPIIFSQGSGEVMRITTGNVGIGTTAPSRLFHAYGTVRLGSTGNIYDNNAGHDFSSSNNSAPVLTITGTGTADLLNVIDNTTEVFTILDGGNVGIGTTNPLEKLHLQVTTGDAIIHFQSGPGSGVGKIGSSGSRDGLQYNASWAGGNGSTKHWFTGTNAYTGDNLTFMGIEPSIAQSGVQGYTALKVNVTETTTGSGAKNLMDLQVGGASKMVVTNTGNVSITGTLTTGAINGQIINTTPAFNALTVGGGYGDTTTNEVGGLSIDNLGTLKLDGDIWLKGTVYRPEYEQLNIQNNAITLNTQAANPTDLDAYIGAMSGGTTTAPTYTGLLKWNATPDRWDLGTAGAPNHLYVSGNVGIGTTAPSQLLNVKGVGAQIKLESGAGGGAVTLNFNPEGADGAFFQVGTTLATLGGSSIPLQIRSSAATTPIYFSTYDGSWLDRMIILKNGNVGIGTTNPSQLFSVGSSNNFTVSSTGGLSIGNNSVIYGFLNMNGNPVRGIANGTTAIPGLAFLNTSTGLGIYSPAADNLGIVIGGSEKVRIDASGNVGIGTTAPGTALDVAGVANVSTGFRVAGSAANGNYLRGNGTNFVSSGIQVTDVPTLNQNTTGTAGSTALLTPLANYIWDDRTTALNWTSGVQSSFVTTGEPVGSTWPSFGSVLSVKTYNGGGGTFQIYAPYGSSYGGTSLRYRLADYTASSSNPPWTSWKTIVDISGANFTGNITTTGNVGIGTTAPTKLLDVRNASPTIGLMETGTFNFMVQTADSNGAYLVWGDSDNAKPLQIGTYSDYSQSGWNPKVTITNAGNVGIGTTAPGYKLDVRGGDLYVSGNITAAGTVTGVGGAYASGSGTQNYISKWNNAAGDTLGNSSIYDNGNVGIGTTSPATALELSTVNNSIFRITNSTTALGDGATIGKIEFWSNDTERTGSGTNLAAYIWAKDNPSGAAYGRETDLAFGTNSNSVAVAERMRISKTGGLSLGTATWNGTDPGAGNVAIQGNVGIGTTAPLSKLHINGGTATLATGLTFGDGDSGIYQWADNRLDFAVGSANRMLISANLIGFGSSDAYPGVNVASIPSATNPGYLLNRDDTNTGIGGTGTDTISLITAGNSRMYFDATGNVGIGTTGPTSPFQVNFSLGNFTVVGTSGGFTGYAKISGGAGGLFIDSAQMTGDLIPDSGNLRGLGTATRTWKNFYTNLITDNGTNVGIGTTAPGAQLDITGTGGLRVMDTTNTVQSLSVGVGAVNDILTFGGSASGGYSRIIGGRPAMNFSNGGTAGRVSFRNVDIGNSTVLGIAYNTDSFVVDKPMVVLGNNNSTNGDFRITSGNVGIGTTNPQYKLDVNGTARISGVTLLAGGLSDLSTLTVTGNTYLATTSGNVGIGTMAPGSKLTVQGSGTGGGTSGLNVTNSAGTSILFVRDDGRVGINNTSPGAGLDVIGGINATWISMGGGTILSPSNGYLMIGSGLSGVDTNSGIPMGIGKAGAANTNGSIFEATTSSTTANNAAGYFSQTGATTGTDYGVYVTNTGAATTNIGLYATATGATNNYAAIFDNGNVGIGTTSPTQKLEVNGTVKATSFDGAISTSGNVASSGNLLVTGAGPHYISQGNVGIGTTAPGATLDVNGLSILRSYMTLYGGGTLTGYFGAGGGIMTVAANTNSDLGIRASGVIGFAVNGSSAPSVIINSSGNVGIGTTGPLAKLHINGGTGTLATGLVFGDGDSGIYQSADNYINLQTPGWVGINAQQLYGGHSSYFAIQANQAASATSPVFLPAGTDADTGIGRAGDNILSLIAGGTNGLNVISDGNVGIGTTAPLAKLHIGGTTSLAASGIAFGDGDDGIYSRTNNVLTFNLNGSNYYEMQSTQFRAINLTNGWYLNYAEPTSTVPIYTFNGDTDTGIGWAGANILSLIAGGTNGLNVISDGNVGIGTTSPGQKLEVNGKILSSNFVWNNTNQSMRAGDGVPTDATRLVSYGYNTGGGAYSSLFGAVAGGSSTGTYVSAFGALAAYQNTGTYVVALGNSAAQANSGNEILAIGYSALSNNTGVDVTAVGQQSGQTNTGSYGTYVGAYSGQYNTGARSLFLGYSSGTNNTGNDVVAIGYQAGKDNSTANQFIVKQANINATPLIQGNFSTGNVGIGTTGPTVKLQVLGATDLFQVSGTNDKGFYIGDNASYVDVLGINKGLNAYNAINFRTGGFVQLYLATTGNVGIGTTGPTEKLEVSGNIKLSGRIRQGSMGDVAEMMALSPMVIARTHSGVAAELALPNGKGKVNFAATSRDGVEKIYALPQPNDVVMIDRNGGIRLSDEPNSTQVIGVVSVNPAQILREELPNSVPVALSGTVPCRVTTENGPIYPGDMLTSSSKPGYAMKADPPKMGSIIGKAMEPLEEGEGEIMIFVTRQ